MTFDAILAQARKNAAAIQKIAAKLHIDLPDSFPVQIKQLNDCLDVYSAAKVLIATTVQDATGTLDLAGWAKITSNFDKNWDAFAKEYNELFNKADSEQQTNILESFAREHFGDNIFEAGSILKNETPQILSGINEFKAAVKSFGGSYRNPVVAANKIKQGVNTIVRSTEKIAKSANVVLKYAQKRLGLQNQNGSVILDKLSTLSQNRFVATSMSTLNIGASGLNAFQSAGALATALRNGDFKGAYAAGKNTYANIKSIFDEVKNISKKKAACNGANMFTRQSTASDQSAASSKSTQPSGPSYSYVCSKAKIKCSNGDKISSLTVLPSRTIWLYGQPQANISDHVSMINIAPCGKCHTTAYPPTGSATAANHGKLTPMPCVPNTPFPWMNGKNDVLLKGDPALISTSKLKCIYGGTITITFDGQSV